MKRNSLIGATSGNKPLKCALALAIGSLTILQVLVLLCAFSRPAYAYIDPGSGLLALQIVATTFAGLVFMIRRRIVGLYRSIFPGRKNEEGGQQG